MTHQHVALDGHRHRQPGGGADGRVEQVVGVRVEVDVGAVAVGGVDAADQHDEEVDGVARQLDDVGDGKRDEERGRRRRHLALAEDGDAERVAGEAKRADERVAEESGEELRRLVEVPVPVADVVVGRVEETPAARQVVAAAAAAADGEVNAAEIRRRRRRHRHLSEEEPMC